MRIQAPLLVFFLLWCAGCTTLRSACQGCETPSRPLKPTVVFPLRDDQKISVRVEMACTSEERARGLMYRKSLAPMSGMLFVFPYSQEHSFWMKNTIIPLDMIHINKAKEVVGIVENATPYSTESRTVGQSALYVLEVNAFFARKHGIRVGQRVEFVDIPGC